MKTSIAAALSLALSLSPASAYCSYDGSNLTCTGGAYAYPRRSFVDGYLGGLNVASHYAMVNAYREAHGLPRCHYGILGAIMSASDGRPMC
jgi:hypothetical protein